METLGNNLNKNSKKFYCDKCDILCSYKSAWDRHILTRKHLDKINNINQKETVEEIHKCLICNNLFKTRSGLWKHNKICKENVSSETQETQNNDMITLIKDIFINMVKENNEIKSLLVKVLETNTINEINSYNSHNVNSNNKTFNLQVFLNETCKNAMNITDFVSSIKPTLEDLENVGRVGYAEGISKIIINNLSKMKITERPIHCSDTKREVVYIKDEDEWNKEEDDKPILTNAIKHIANENIKNINAWKLQNPGCTDPDSNKNDMYLNIVSNSMCGLTKEEINKNMSKIITKISKKPSLSECKI